MHRVLAAAVVAAAVGLTPTAAMASCATYAEACEAPPASVLPTTLERGSVEPAVVTSDVAPDELPITGGELVLISAAAAAALGSGVVLAASGRRRGDRTAPERFVA